MGKFTQKWPKTARCCHPTLRCPHPTLRRPHRTLRRGHRTLRCGHPGLRPPHRTLRRGHPILRRAHRTLRRGHPTLRRAHRTLRDAHRTLRRAHRTNLFTVSERFFIVSEVFRFHRAGREGRRIPKPRNPRPGVRYRSALCPCRTCRRHNPGPRRKRRRCRDGFRGGRHHHRSATGHRPYRDSDFDISFFLPALSGGCFV